jgi:Ca2+-binding RTX toxin-like protein
MFWMTALLGMVVMGSLDFFSAEPIGETDVDDDTVGDTIDDDLDLSGPENQRDAPLLDHGIADFSAPQTLTSTSSEPLRGSDTADRLIGHDGTDRLHGDAGNDTLNGLDGADDL